MNQIAKTIARELEKKQVTANELLYLIEGDRLEVLSTLKKMQKSGFVVCKAGIYKNAPASDEWMTNRGNYLVEG